MKKLFAVGALSFLLMPAASLAQGSDRRRHANAAEISELGITGAAMVGAAVFLRLRFPRKAK